MVGKRNASGQRRPSKKDVFTTQSGHSIKMNRSIGARVRANREAKARRRAVYLSSLPKNRFKRAIYRLQPKRLAKYWFSREGGIMALKLTGLGIAVCFILIVGVFAYFRKDLPQVTNINGANLGGSISYYDRTGQTLLWQDYNAVERTPVTSDNISPYLKEATVATEDKSFYTEGAFSAKGIFRAAYDDVFHSSAGTQGGSTITQQLVKLNENWTANRTIGRKVKELILAVELGRDYNKDQILTAYLNIAPYGNVQYGVQAAAQDYFGKDAKDLTLPEAAMLAGIPQAPSYYSPYGSLYDPPALISRQHYVLDQMVKQGMITKQQEQQAETVNIIAEIRPEQSRYQNITAPYFVLQAKQQLENTYGSATVQRGGWKVITTLNLSLQQDAEQDVAANARRVTAVGGDQEAMVAEDVNTGQVVAEVGGEDFNNPQYGQINYAGTNIQPGSSLKPFLYAALIQNNTNVGAGSVIYDSQGALPGYPCTDTTRPTANSNGGNCLWDDNFVYPGPETIRYALAGSRNVPAVKASLEVDPTDTSPGYTNSVNQWINLANNAIGVKGAYGCYPTGTDVETATVQQQTQCYGSAALGSGEIPIDQEVNGDVTLARLGQEVPETYIIKITDAEGKTVYQWSQPKSTQVYKADTAYIINSMLDDPRASYLTTAQKFQHYNGWDIAVKTGTENQEYNGVMTAWSTQYAVIGFVGYHTLNKPLIEGHFEDITEPITRTWMEQALTALHTKPINWTQPSDIKVLPAYVQRTTTGFGAQVPGPTDELFPSWFSSSSGGSKYETIDKVSGMVATSCTPALAKETVGGAKDSSFTADIFYPRVYRNMAALESAENGGTTIPSVSSTDNVHNCNDSMPSISVQETNCDDVSKCDFTVAVTQGTDALSGGGYTSSPAGTISLLDNGQVVATVTIPSGAGSVYNTTIPGVTVNNGDTVTAQVVDSVLYSGTSSPLTVQYSTTPQGNGNGNGNGGNSGNGQ